MSTTRFRTAFVTGASSGLGRAIAVRLAQRGAHVVLAARREAELERAAEEVRAAGGAADVQVLDVRDRDAAAAAVEAWDERLGGLDLVLANAGVALPARLDAQSWQRAVEVLEINLLGAVAVLCAALPRMCARESGTLAGMSSLASLRGMPGSGTYSASKAGLSTFLESLQADLARSRVRVVDIQPGFVRTPMTDANEFEMPFLCDLDPAVRRCVDGLERGKLVVHFPWQLSWPLRLLARPLPRAAWVRLARGGGLRGRRPPSAE